VAKEKKKKETSAVKYNTSGHYRGRRYNEWVKKCMEYEVEGIRPSGRLGLGFH